MNLHQLDIDLINEWLQLDKKSPTGISWKKTARHSRAGQPAGNVSCGGYLIRVGGVGLSTEQVREVLQRSRSERLSTANRWHEKMVIDDSCKTGLRWIAGTRKGREVVGEFMPRHGWVVKEKGNKYRAADIIAAIKAYNKIDNNG